MLIASIIAGADADAGADGEDEMNNWRKLAQACVNVGCDALELNLSCSYMDRKDMGPNNANDEDVIKSILYAVPDAVTVPIWVKLTPRIKFGRRRWRGL